jgi:hypothetical protein
MNWFRKHAIALGGTAVAVSLITLTAPRAAHALVVALVQVTNTVATPAITQDVSKLASQNVQILCVGATNCTQILPDGSSPVPTFDVPSGSHLVITTVQINTPSATSVQLNQSGPTFGVRGSWTLIGAGSFQFQYPSGIVFSSGSDLFIPNQSDRTYLTGYLVSN